MTLLCRRLVMIQILLQGFKVSIENTLPRTQRLTFLKDGPAMLAALLRAGEPVEPSLTV